MQFTTKEYATNWNRIEVVIEMGFSVAPKLFVQVMQLLLKTTENNDEIIELIGGFQMPPGKVFRDDSTILQSKESTCHKILSLIEKQIIWCKMKFKP